MARARIRCIRVKICDTKFDPPRPYNVEGRCDKCLSELGITKPDKTPKPLVIKPISNPVQPKGLICWYPDCTVASNDLCKDHQAMMPIWPQNEVAV